MQQSPSSQGQREGQSQFCSQQGGAGRENKMGNEWYKQKHARTE